MNTNIQLFLEKVAQDSALQERFAQIRDPEEAYRLAAETQEGFTKEEFIEEMTRIRTAAEENLTDEDLAQSAGGKLTDMIAPMITGICAAAI